MTPPAVSTCAWPCRTAHCITGIRVLRAKSPAIPKPRWHATYRADYPPKNGSPSTTVYSSSFTRTRGLFPVGMGRTRLRASPMNQNYQTALCSVRLPWCGYNFIAPTSSIQTCPPSSTPVSAQCSSSPAAG